MEPTFSIVRVRFADSIPATSTNLKTKSLLISGRFVFDALKITLSIRYPERKKLLTSFKKYDIKFPMKKEPIDVKAIRLELGFTQEDLARELGLTLSTVSKWEQGISSPSPLAREKIENLVKKGGKKKK